MNIKKSIFAVVLLFVAAFIVSCNQADVKESDKKLTDSVVKVEAPGKATLKNVEEQAALDAYLALKDNLIVADSVSAQKSASNLSDMLNTLNWTEAKTEATKIGNTNTLAAQRKTFTDLSNYLIIRLEKVDFSSGNVYMQHCPMANNGDGGDWLSLEKSIRNPYYGSEMMECGSVERTFGVK